MAPKGNSGEDSTGGAAAQALNVAVLRSSSNLTFAFAFVGLLGMIIQHELAWYYNTIAQYGPLCADARDTTCDPRITGAMWPIRTPLGALDAIRAVIITFPTLLAMVFIYRFYGALLALEHIKNRQPATATLLSVPHLRWRLFLELIAISVHVFPGVEQLASSPDLYLFLTLVS